MKKLLALLLVIIAICTGAIYMLPSTLKKASETVLSEVLQTPVEVNGIDFSVTNATFKIADVTIKDYAKFSDNNLFEMKNLTVAVDPKSLLTEVITIKELSIADLGLKLTGGIKENSLKELQHVISLREQFEAQEKAEHIATNENHDGHNHHKSELKLKINTLTVDNIALAAHITKPFELPEKQLAIRGLKAKNIGGETGLSVHNTVKTVIEDIDLAVTAKIEEILPAQKAYEETKLVVEKGIDESKKFIEETFTKENVNKTKEKADELIGKYFK